MHISHVCTHVDACKSCTCIHMNVFMYMYMSVCGLYVCGNSDNLFVI